MMKICVLGAGVVGLTTAWLLSEAGHDVTILERNGAVGLGASFGNGAQLSYQFVAPLASPGTLKKLPSMLLEADSPMRVRPGFDPSLISWGLQFLSACRPKIVSETTVAQLALAALSRAEMDRLNAKLKLNFALKTAGKLIVYRTQSAFDHARSEADLDQKVLTPRECLTLEPALRFREQDLSGGIYTESEQVGDCAAFCGDLARQLSLKNNVSIQLETSVTRPIMSGGRLVAVDTDKGRIEADCFVLCLGAQARVFAKACGFSLPIYPLKGYSLTLPTHADKIALSHSVTDSERKIVFAPLTVEGRGMVRVAGIADLEGDDMSIDQTRLDILKRASVATLDADVSGDIKPWVGLRPTTPDSRPIIGWSRVPGLFLNAGQGMLGWTLACGSARLTADLIERRQPQIDANAFAPSRVY